MLTQLSTLKARLEITVTTYDTILTNAISAVSARFEKECNRTFGRAEVTQEFAADRTEIILAAYPYQAITVFSLKSSEAEGWLDQPEPEYLVRNSCVISLSEPLGSQRQQARIVYTGGYVLPGDTVLPGLTPLPGDLEQAAVEQCAAWFLNRDKVGLVRSWPHGGTYEQFSGLDLLPNVQTVLKRYQRWSI